MNRTLAAAILADALAALLVALLAQPARASHGSTDLARNTFTTIGVELDVARGRIVGTPRLSVTEYELPGSRRILR
jgi:hypothetical protein